MACGILVRWPEIELAPPAWSPNHWVAKKVPELRGILKWETFQGSSFELLSTDVHRPRGCVSHFPLQHTGWGHGLRSAPERLTHSTSQRPTSRWEHDSESRMLLSQFPLFLPRLSCSVTASLLSQCLSAQFPLLLNASSSRDLEQKQNSRAVLSNGNTDWT